MQSIERCINYSTLIKPIFSVLLLPLSHHLLFKCTKLSSLKTLPLLPSLPCSNAQTSVTQHSCSLALLHDPCQTSTKNQSDCLCLCSWLLLQEILPGQGSSCLMTALHAAWPSLVSKVHFQSCLLFTKKTGMFWQTHLPLEYS